jgi:hypothetical protein
VFCGVRGLGSQERTDAAPTAAQPGLRAQWSREKLVKRQSGETKCFPDRLIRCYGEEYANKVKHAQAFGTCK